MKVIVLLVAFLPLLPASAGAAPPAAWTIGERAGRKCLLTPEGNPFLLIGISHASLAMSEGGLPYFLGYFKCQYMDQPMPTGMLKQGLLKPDGTTYPEFPRLLAGIHQRLMEQWRSDSRLDLRLP